MTTSTGPTEYTLGTMDVAKVEKAVLQWFDLRKMHYRFEKSGATNLDLRVSTQNLVVDVNVFWNSTFLTVLCFLPFVVSPAAAEGIIVSLNVENLKMPLGCFELRRERICYKLGSTLGPSSDVEGILTSTIAYIVTTANVRGTALGRLCEEANEKAEQV